MIRHMSLATSIVLSSCCILFRATALAILSVKNGLEALKTNKNGLEALKTNKNGLEALKTSPTPLQLLIKEMPGEILSSFPDLKPTLFWYM